MDLIEKARKARGDKDSKENKGKDATQIQWFESSIVVTEFEKGKAYTAHYDHWNNCRDCNEWRLLSGETGGSCPVCDKSISLKDYLEHFPEKESKPQVDMFTPDKPKPKIPEIKEDMATGSAMPTNMIFGKAEKPTAPKKVIDITPDETKKSTATFTHAKNEIFEITPIEVSQPKTIEEYKQALEITKARTDYEIEVFKYVMSKIITKDDKGVIQKNEFIKKSGVRKLMTAFNISARVIDEKSKIEKDEKGQWVVEMWAIAEAPNGRTFMDVGICEQFEKKRTRTKHDTVATAVTRAINRAALGLFGFGLVSYEEIKDKDSKDIDPEDGIKSMFD